MTEQKIPIPHKNILSFVGPRDEYIKLMRSILGCKIFIDDENVIIRGEDKAVLNANKAIENFISNLNKCSFKKEDDILYFITHSMNSQISEDLMISTNTGKIFPRSEGQKQYIQAMNTSELTICIGPAGTGKTFLAVAKAVELLLTKVVKRIILTRPAVEAGENLGFLPGDFIEKVLPYLRPLYDSLYMTLSKDKTKKLIELSIIEIAPLAFMRGRTLNDACIILDEAQNTTPSQMKMFLTRLGKYSKTIVCGDVTQSDLTNGKSGLSDISRFLNNIQDIKIVYLTRNDVVRHKLVKAILKAYEREDK